MIWLIAGIVPPVLWALVNHTDKYLLSKAKHHSSVDVLMVYSTWFSFIVLPILFFFARHELFRDWRQIGVQVLGGLFLTLAIYFYLMALNKDEASVVMPLALLVPVFGYLFSYILLGEVLSFKQIVACSLILFGSLILSLEFEEERKIRIKHGVLWFMILATAMQAAQDTVFKFATVQNSYIVSVFWMHIGMAASGVFLVLIKKDLFANFMDSVRINGKLIFGTNILSEGLSSLASMIQNYAILLAPVAVIMTFNGYQPVFVFILGTLLTILTPKFVTERIKPRHLLHKGLAISVILIGTILVSQTI